MKRFVQLGVLCLPMVLFACGSAGDTEPDSGYEEDGDFQPPDYWRPGDELPANCSYGYGENCPDPTIDCGNDPCLHGVCVESSEQTADVCVCAEGYSGLVCDACAVGYVVDGLDCVKADLCAAGPCVYGTCRESGGDYYCSCYDGYTGQNCDECAEGYHPENLECVPD